MVAIRKNRRVEGLAQALLAAILFAATAVAQTPAVNEGGLVNGADFRPVRLSGGAIAQGSIFSLFGTEFSSTAFDAETFPLLREVDGVRVEVVAAGVVYEAPLLHVDPEQINGILPSDVPVGPGSVRVVRDGQTSNAEPIKVVRTFPGLFLKGRFQHELGTYSNSRQEAAAHGYDSGEARQLTQGHPAEPGGLITLWATGIFATPGFDDVPVAPLGRLSSPVGVVVGGREAEIVYRGPSSCCVGVDQLNVRLPPDVLLGCFVPVQLVGGGLPSNMATIPIAEAGQSCAQRESHPLRVYLTRQWQDGVAGDHASVLTGRLVLDPNELPPVGACQAYSRPQYIVSTSTLPGEQTVEVQGPNSTFTPFPNSPAGELGPGLYTVVSDGSDWPSFETTLEVQPPPVWTNQQALEPYPRQDGVRFEWEGLSLQLAGNQHPPLGIITANRSLVCNVDLSGGAFTVGPETLSFLDGRVDWSFGTIMYAPLQVETDGPETGQLVYTELVAQSHDLGRPRLPASPVRLPNGDSIQAELAVSTAERGLGLMNRTELPADQGMLFFFDSPGFHGFWMSQTLIPLDIIWLDADRRIVTVSANTPPCPEGVQCPIYGPDAPSMYVLELTGGEAANRNLQVGDQLSW